jgi:DNA repair photolyase
MRTYTGIRLTADGFDCALPVTIDSHSVCSYNCSYCFSEQLPGHQSAQDDITIGETSLKAVEAIFSGGGGVFAERMRKALRYDLVKAGEFQYPCPVQLGGINDPCDGIERQRGWLKQFIPLAIKYQQPVRISTKGTALMEPDYLRLLEKGPELFWVAFSIISPDDELLPKVDVGAPSPSERLAAMKAVTDIGCKASLRFRPIMPGLSDRTPNHDRAYQDLIKGAYDAGARAISAEVAFLPMRFDARQKLRWQRMEKLIDRDLTRIYKSMGKAQTCFRASYKWTEQIMRYVKMCANHYGMTLGVSDPLWKQLTETGCCCGMLPNDKVFGNWERENATNALLMAKETGKPATFDQIVPPWSKDCLMSTMCHLGAGPKTVYDKRHRTWEEYLRSAWYEVKKDRSPLNYFQGALRPRRLDDGDLVYDYAGLPESGTEDTPHWDLLPPKFD